MGTRKIICMGSLFFLSVAIPYEKREDVLLFTTPLLHTAVEVTGMVELKLYVSFKQL